MNVSELARRLRVNPKVLREVLPQYGFDIGAKAIKVDDRVAQKIMRDWRRIKKDLERKEQAVKDKKKQAEKIARQESGATVILPAITTVKDFAERLDLPVTRVITELMKNGVLASQNERIDRDTAGILAEELGFSVEMEAEVVEEVDDGALESVLQGQDKEKMQTRPPVVVVMGHVDHGKTKLLDAIRQTNVAEGESGGITQHIGAYQVNWHSKDGDSRDITFIDTPGHQAFTVMRSRGAKAADIAILVVAADDGVKPQTLEVIDIIKAAKIPYVVAINKIDKEDANADKVRTELSQRGVQPEEWGGDVPTVEISAKENMHIDKLLDVLLLVADVNEGEIQANPDRDAAGTVIESHVDKGQGPVATILVQAGTLNVGDPLVVNGEVYGKVRAMKTFRGEDVKSAPPSMPVKILGFKVAPDVGDILDVAAKGDAQKIDVRAKKVTQKGAQQQSAVSLEQSGTDSKKNLHVLVKADVLGSLEAVLSEFEKLKYDEVGVKVIGKGVGNISDDDVRKAIAADARVIGFRVGLSPVAEEFMRDKDINFYRYEVIYDLLDFVKAEMEGMLSSEEIIHEEARGKVLKIFRTEKKKQTVGVQVEDGTVKQELRVRVRRGDDIVGEGSVVTLQVGKGVAKTVPAGSQCGVGFEGNAVIEEGDVLEFYSIESKKKTLQASG